MVFRIPAMDPLYSYFLLNFYLNDTHKCNKLWKSGISLKNILRNRFKNIQKCISNQFKDFRVDLCNFVIQYNLYKL